MSSEVALRYLPPSLDCSPNTSPRAQISWIVSPFSWPMTVVGRAFHDTDAGLLCVPGGGRIVMEVDGWVEALGLFDVQIRRPWTRFE